MSKSGLTHPPHFLNVSNLADAPCARHSPRVVLVQPVDVGHEEEVICAAHAGGDGGQGVVVSEFVDVEDLGDRDGVVLVDDRNDAEG